MAWISKQPARRYNFRNILSAAQYESDLNSERTLAGLAVARAKVGGRRPKFTDEQWREMGERMATGESRQSVSKTYGVGLSTLYKKFQLADNWKETEKGTNIVYFNVPFNLLIGG
ncbi:hypothetical protein MS6204_02974 [Escherichia coli]|nr:hypothetical protein [Escherichia coli]